MPHRQLLAGLLAAGLLGAALASPAHALGQASVAGGASAKAALDDPATQAAMDAWSRDYESAMAARAQALAGRGDVRSLLGAMMIMPTADAASGDAPGVLGPQARDWFARARQLGPADPLVAWVEVTDCHVLGCDRDAAIARLLQVDGNNAAAHLWANGVATESGDLRAAREHLHSAALAPRYEPYAGRLLGLLLDARAGAETPAMDARVSTGIQAATGSRDPADFMAMQALGQWAAIALAPMQGVSQLCGSGSMQATRDPALRSDCIALLSRLASDDSTLPYAQMATRLLIALDPGLARQWMPRLRQLGWWQERSLPLLADFSGTPGAEEYARWVANEGELGAMARLLDRAGVAAVPPEGWQLPPQLR